jgi:putative transposase
MTKELTPVNLDLIDQLLKDYKSPEDVLGENGLLKQLTKAVLERAMAAELTHHLGYEKHDTAGHNTGNSRNGKSRKTLKGEFGTLPIEVPRDRNSSIEPKIVPKGQTRFEGFDDLILSLYARGMTTREIQAHLEEIYQVEVSASLISTVTDAAIDEVRAWQTRPLESLYPIIYLDCIMVKIRDGAHVLNKAIYLVIGVNLEGIKEVLGMWVAQTEGAKFWLGVVTELKNRGVQDIFIACGWAERIARSDRGSLPEGRSAAMYRALGEAIVELCQLERTQGGGFGPEADLQRGHPRRGRDAARGVCR